MGSSFLPFENIFDYNQYELEVEELPGDYYDIHPNDLYDDGDPTLDPSMKSFVVYSVVTTIICTFGIFGNILSLAVLRRKELVGSVYTYLAVLAATDLALSVTFFIGALGRGDLICTDWSKFDALIGLPIGGTLNSLGVMATVCVTTDRVLYLWNPVQCVKPKFCNPKIARLLMGISVVLSVLLNLPYCFIFEWGVDGKLMTTDFFRSRAYTCYNWFILIILTIIPGIILIFGNGFLIMTLQKARRVTMKCNGKRRRDHTNLTITLVCIIILFLVTEIPSNLISKTRAVTLIFFGDYAAHDSDILELIRAICTVLGAVNVTINFLFYYLFCPAFCRSLRLMFLKNKKTKKKLLVKVIVLNENSTKMLEVATKSFRSPLINNSHKVSDQVDSDYVEIYHFNGNGSSGSEQVGCYEKELSTETLRDGY